jgi:hypothetical protein
MPVDGPLIEQDTRPMKNKAQSGGYRRFLAYPPDLVFARRPIAKSESSPPGDDPDDG